jgi:pimeloyl-ACP methyl ester carboxylesterase
VNPVGREDLPAGDIRAMQRNTARFALQVSRGLFGASPLLGPILAASVSDPARMPPTLVGRYLAPFIGQEGVAHLLALARAVRAIDLEELDLAQVRAHTLIIRGEKDAWVDPAVAQKLAAEIPECRVTTLPEAARLIPEESPDELADMVTAFISPHVNRPDQAMSVYDEGSIVAAGEDDGTPEGGMA